MTDDTSTDTVVAADDEYIPSGEDIEMSGGTPPRKAKHFWPSVKRLFGLMASEKMGLINVVALVVGSVILTDRAEGAIARGLVGFDIGCGMMSARSDVPWQEATHDRKLAFHREVTDRVAAFRDGGVTMALATPMAGNHADDVAQVRALKEIVS